MNTFCFETSAPESKKYIFTIDPPAIFVAQSRIDPKILNRIQALAILYNKYVRKQVSTQRMSRILYNGAMDPKGVAFYQSLLSSKSDDDFFSVSDKLAVIPAGKNWNYEGIQENEILVLHNNGNAFGDNLTSSDDVNQLNSMDGAAGVYTTAAFSTGVPFEPNGKYLKDKFGLPEPVIELIDDAL